MRKAFANWQFRAFIYAFVLISELFAGLRMYELIDKTSDAIQAWAVTVLAGITAVYALQTKAQADASVEMARGLFRPVISIKYGGVSEEDATAWFALENEGAGPAMNVHVFFSHRPYRSEGKFYRYLPVSKDNTPFAILPLQNLPRGKDGFVVVNYEGVEGHKWHSKAQVEKSGEVAMEIGETQLGIPGHFPIKDSLS